jgi:hypothetical protein
VLANPHTTFHPCTCGLRGGAAVVAATLIGYDDVEVAAGATMRRRRSWMTTSSTLTRDHVGLLLQLFFRCSACPVVTIHDLLLASILWWHSRRSASVYMRSCIFDRPQRIYMFYFWKESSISLKEYSARQLPCQCSLSCISFLKKRAPFFRRNRREKILCVWCRIWHRVLDILKQH